MAEGTFEYPEHHRAAIACLTQADVDFVKDRLRWDCGLDRHDRHFAHYYAYLALGYRRLAKRYRKPESVAATLDQAGFAAMAIERRGLELLGWLKIALPEESACPNSSSPSPPPPSPRTSTEQPAASPH